MEIMSATDLSRYLKINKRKLYELVREGKLPSMRIGDTHAFMRELIDRWILENTEHEQQCFLAGSDDVHLKNVIDSYNNLYGELIFYAPVGSISGLRALKEKKATMSCVNMPYDAEKENEVPYVDKYLSTGDYVVVRLFLREQGIIVQKGNPKRIKSLQDVAAKGAIFVNRNPASGTRLLLDSLLEKEHVDPTGIKGYGVEVGSHLRVGLSVLTGAADAGPGIRHAAHMLGLDFVFLVKERVDMVIPKEYYFGSHVKAFLAFFEQASPPNNAWDCTGYDMVGMGPIAFPGGYKYFKERLTSAPE